MSNIKLVFKYAFKDLTKQKVRTILGVLGTAISIGLLAIVLFVSDSVSVSFVDYLSRDAGNQDMVVSIRHYNGEPANRSSYFEYKPVIDQIEEATDQIKNYIPRMEIGGTVNISESFDNKEITNLQKWSTISGINFSLENEINFGYFKDPDSDKELKLDGLDSYHCAIYTGFNDVIKYSEEENITVRMAFTHGDTKLNQTVDLVIDEIFDYELKWPASYGGRNLIVVDINTLYEIFGQDEFQGRCNKLVMTFKDTEGIYDARNIEGSEEKVKAIASDVQLELGLEEYNIDLPKLEILGYSEFLTMGITIIFIFVSIIAMLIAGILINGILKTSVEERIREFGIFRTLGAHKKFNLWVVLVQGFILCNFGILLGIVGAYFGTQGLLIPLANEYLLGGFAGGTTIVFSFNLISILIAYAMGISVGLLVSISPALKVMKLQLIESIHPYRHEDTLYNLQKKASVNYKLIIVGLILAFNGGFIYFVIPRLLLSMDITLMAGTLIAVLMIFLIGLTLAGLGLIPIVLRIFIYIFKPMAKRMIQVIRIFVFRYQRRNSSTVIIFALSFSFVAFTSTVLQTQSSQIAVMTRLRFGSDLVIETTGWEDYDEFFGGGDGGFGGGGIFGGGGGLFSKNPSEEQKLMFNPSTSGTSYQQFSYETSQIELAQSDEIPVDPERIMNTEMKYDLLAIEGIEKVSSVLASPFQLTQIYSVEKKEFSASLGDYAGLSSTDITLLGVDEEYPSTVDEDYIAFNQGEKDEAFNAVFNSTEHNCIISEAIALQMNLQYGDKIRLNIQRGDESQSYPFTIVGTASSMPGFSNRFGGSQYGASRGGVLVNQEIYLDLIDVPEITWVDKFFIKLMDGQLASASKVEGEIENKWQNDYDYNLYNLERRVRNQQEAFSIVDTLFTLILMATVVICLFGLLSSSYSTILERKKEIGIIRTLGLKGHEINRMFIIEALIIMLASGTVGVMVGWFTGYLLSSNLNLFTDIPYNPEVPWVNLAVVYSASIAFLLVGMYLMLRKSRKQKIVDIYRETQ